MDYSILVNSCDAYSDVWSLFFYVLKKTWVGELPTIYLNTETKTVDYNFIEIRCLNYEKSETNSAWGDRLIRAIERIPETYILMLLEDFIFEDSIKTDVIEDCCDRLKNDGGIIAFQLTPNGEFEKGIYPKENDLFEGFAKRRRGDLFTVVAGPTLWRKSDLLALTKKNDNPWEWEYFGSFRTILYGKNVFCWKSKTNCVFNYDVDHGGAIHRGKWVGYKMREIEQKYDFHIDYGNREIEDDWMKSEENNKPLPRYKRLGSILKNRTKIIVNIVYGFKCRFRRKPGYGE